MNVCKLRGIIAEKGLTQEQVAKEIGITPKTFYSKMKKGVFGTDEAMRIAVLLDIKDPGSIFFSKEVT